MVVEASLRGKAVLITGGSRGLGLAFARGVAASGCNIVITGRDAESLGRARAELEAIGAATLAVPGDVTDPEMLPAAVDSAVAAFGSLDVMINNAGQGGPVGPTWEVDIDEWWNLVDVHLKGTLLGCRAAIPHMIRRGQGRIINIASRAGLKRWPLVTAYSVSKAAVMKLTENLAAELQQHAIAVLSYHPGHVNVGMTKTFLEKAPGLDDWSVQVARWVRQQAAEGHFTDIEQSTATFLRIARGDADHLSGRYLTPDSTFADVEHGRPAGTREEKMEKC